MSESEDDSSKTEEPSQKKLEEARKKGQIASSRELNHLFMMGSFLFFAVIMGPQIGRQTMNFLRPFITDPDNFEMSSGDVVDSLFRIVLGTLAVLALPFLLTIVAALAPQVLQKKIVFSTEHIKPKLSNFRHSKALGGCSA